MKSFVLMFLGAAVVALAGCSGSSVTPPPPPPPAEASTSRAEAPAR